MKYLRACIVRVLIYYGDMASLVCPISSCECFVQSCSRVRMCVCVCVAKCTYMYTLMPVNMCVWYAGWSRRLVCKIAGDSSALSTVSQQ